MGERSLERNNSVFSRKDLIKKEYNKIMDQRLPNILSLMNQDKYNISAGETGSVHDLIAGSVGAMDYDETELLSKMFSKDHNKYINEQ